jgi:hypothetical protein
MTATAKTENAVKLTVADLAAAYHTDTGTFLKGATGLLGKVQKHRAETPDVGQAVITLGLHAAVLVQEFITKESFSPSWFGKTADDFVRAQFGVGPKDYFPPKVYGNARLVLAVSVKIETVKDETTGAVSTKFVSGIFPEADYLETSQRGLDLLAKIVFHEKVKGRNGPDLNNSFITRAVEIAKKRGKKYVSSLQGILDEMDPKEDEAKDFDPVAAIDALETVVRGLGDMDDADMVAKIVAGIYRIDDVLTYKSGLDDESMAAAAKTYVQPKDVADEIERLNREEVLKAAEKATNAALDEVFGTKPAETPAPETPATPDFAAWVRDNQYSDEMKAAIGVPQEELDQATLEAVTAIHAQLGRLPANIEELDALMNAVPETAAA